MNYERLVELIHYQTWIGPEKIKHLLEVMSDVLRIHVVDDQQVRTPLGTFYSHTRQGKDWVLPDGSPTRILEKTQVRLRPSGRLTDGWMPTRHAYLAKLAKQKQAKKLIWDPKKELLDEEDEDLDEDERLEED